MWAAGLKGTPLEWANPGAGRLSPKDLAIIAAGYYGMVSFVDQQVGRILDALEKRSLAKDTLVIFTSDHGELLGDHGMLFKGPVHYEGLLRVPLIISGGSFQASTIGVRTAKMTVSRPATRRSGPSPRR